MKKILPLFFFFLLLNPFHYILSDVPFGYVQFTSLFNNYFDNKPLNKPIPHNSFTKPLFNLPVVNHKISTVGKINNYRDLDLFIVSDIYNYKDTEEESVYGSKDFRRTRLLIFKEGKYINEYSIAYNMDYEGGVFTTTYSILKDTTFRLNKNFEECCSATGYDTKIGTYMTSLCQLEPSGYMRTKAITKMEFKSPFFDPSFINRMNGRFKGDFRDYPSEDNKYTFSLDNDIQFLELFDPGVNLSFHFDADENNRMYPVFETYTTNDKLIDQLVLNSSNYNQLKRSRVNQNTITKDDLIQCPVYIYTTLGKIEIRPDGYFTAR